MVAVPRVRAVKDIGGSMQSICVGRHVITVGDMPGCRIAGSLDFGWAGYGKSSAITSCPSATCTVPPLCAGVTITVPRAVLGALDGADGTEDTDGRDGTGAVDRDGVADRDDGPAPDGPALDGPALDGPGADGPEALVPEAELAPGPDSDPLVDPSADPSADPPTEPPAASCVELADTVPEAPDDAAPAFT